MRNSFKIAVYTALFCTFFSQAQAQAEDVTLPFGSKVDKAKLELIFKAKSVPEFIELIERENKDLKVIAIDRGRKRGRVLIPKKYIDPSHQSVWDERGVGAETVGIYIRKGKQGPDATHDIIIVHKTVGLTTLAHEYLHYLIGADPRNHLYTAIYEKKIWGNAIERKLGWLSHEAGRAYKKLILDASNSQVRFYYFETKFMYESLRFLVDTELRLEEIEIETFLLKNHRKLGFNRSDAYHKLGYIYSNLKRLRSLLKEAPKRIKAWGKEVLNYYSEDEKDWTLSILKNVDKVAKSASSRISKGRWFQALVQYRKTYRIPPGDVNCDGVANSEDLSFLLAVIANSRKKLTGAQELFCDVNDDGSIDNRDLAYLVKIFDRKGIKLTIPRARLNLGAIKEKDLKDIKNILSSWGNRFKKARHQKKK